MVKHALIGFLLSIFVQTVFGQISPGELTGAHAHLEGVDNCTKCHSMGKSLSDDHCIACHGEIKSRIDRKKGLHASIGSKQCFDCHKEHHGRQFEIIRYDKKSFDHGSVGFVLQGKHGKVECGQCHTKDNISAKDIQAFPDSRKRKTMLGLSQECQSCHTDQHRGQFTQQCVACHTFDGWKPASKFSHERARFQLTGRHEKVECRTCHKATLEDGKTVRYVRMEFGSCQSCHTDAHKGRFTQACTQCHTTDGFHKVKGAQFKHESTNFPLRGRHAAIPCEKCHGAAAKAKNAAGETGFHITNFRQCTACHADAHARQFENRTDGGRCEACHTENGFGVAQFSVFDHARTRMPLTGAHLAIPCSKCHLGGKVKAKSTRQFRWKGALDCTTCHSDIHKGQFAAKMTNGCETCHTTESWKSSRFAHDKTSFPLKGKHATIECSKCHIKTGTADARYTGTPTRCYDCHADEHERQFAATGGVTQCAVCHTEKNWQTLLFDHKKQSKFALTGKHTNLQCEQCHKSVVVNERKIIRYKPLGAACIDCHPAGK